MTISASLQRKSSLFATRNSCVNIWDWLHHTAIRNQARWSILAFFIAVVLVYLSAFYSLFFYQFMLVHATEELTRSIELVSKSEFSLQQKKIELLQRKEFLQNTFEKISVITYITPASVASSEVRPRP